MLEINSQTFICKNLKGNCDMKKIAWAALIFLFLFIALGVSIHKLGLGHFLARSSEDIIRTGYLGWLNLIALGFFGITFSILGFLLARRRGRNRVTWAILCFFFNLLGFVILWLLPASKGARGQS
jgi:hypothetical protein